MFEQFISFICKDLSVPYKTCFGMSLRCVGLWKQLEIFTLFRNLNILAGKSPSKSEQ